MRAVNIKRGQARTMTNDLRLVSIDEAADRLGLNSKTLRERSYRERIGLGWIKIGRKIKFAEPELVKFIEERRQGTCRNRG
jgi:Helix-turn-helix domain